MRIAKIGVGSDIYLFSLFGVYLFCTALDEETTLGLSSVGLFTKCAFMTARLWAIGLSRMEQSLSMAILLNSLTANGHYLLQHDS